MSKQGSHGIFTNPGKCIVAISNWHPKALTCYKWLSELQIALQECHLPQKVSTRNKTLSR
ncbi:hypothetical protein SERLA73DRAFT_145066 [Serpula lacrymans var. lacrymans S7.3]|uniref:Uncharacterized protein n=1 Tax=Serpula lacrymans var. lacrymans (strain S7.3) TaxID=936435 RepID=F8QCX9_SERL3|nr:hypothetical protein SERLA73DRAFT_145066 [Serpula lacrymans var. lacrymans S7.3]